MGNPPSSGQRYVERPLLDTLGGATHVTIACRCYRQQIWLTSDLVARCPRAVTVRDFVNSLRCKGCGLKGWALITAYEGR